MYQIWLHNRYESKEKNKLYSWVPFKNYHKTLTIWKKINSKFHKFGPFFAWKYVYISQNHIFQFSIWKIFISKKYNGVINNKKQQI